MLSRLGHKSIYQFWCLLQPRPIGSFDIGARADIGLLYGADPARPRRNSAPRISRRRRRRAGMIDDRRRRIISGNFHSRRRRERAEAQDWWQFSVHLKIFVSSCPLESDEDVSRGQALISTRLRGEALWTHRFMIYVRQADGSAIVQLFN